MDEVMQKTSEAMRAVHAMLQAVEALPQSDRRALAVARTQLETGFLWVASAADGGGIL